MRDRDQRFSMKLFTLFAVFCTVSTASKRPLSQSNVASESKKARIERALPELPDEILLRLAIKGLTNTSAFACTSKAMNTGVGKMLLALLTRRAPCNIDPETIAEAIPVALGYLVSSPGTVQDKIPIFAALLILRGSKYSSPKIMNAFFRLNPSEDDKKRFEEIIVRPPIPWDSKMVNFFTGITAIIRQVGCYSRIFGLLELGTETSKLVAVEVLSVWFGAHRIAQNHLSDEKFEELKSIVNFIKENHPVMIQDILQDISNAIILFTGSDDSAQFITINEVATAHLQIQLPPGNLANVLSRLELNTGNLDTEIYFYLIYIAKKIGIPGEVNTTLLLDFSPKFEQIANTLEESAETLFGKNLEDITTWSLPKKLAMVNFAREFADPEIVWYLAQQMWSSKNSEVAFFLKECIRGNRDFMVASLKSYLEHERGEKTFLDMCSSFWFPLFNRPESHELEIVLSEIGVDIMKSITEDKDDIIKKQYNNALTDTTLQKLVVEAIKSGPSFGNKVLLWQIVKAYPAIEDEIKKIINIK